MTSDFAAATAPLLLIIADASPESESLAPSVYLLQCICALALRLAEPFRVAVDNLGGIAHMVRCVDPPAAFVCNTLHMRQRAL